MVGGAGPLSVCCSGSAGYSFLVCIINSKLSFCSWRGRRAVLPVLGVNFGTVPGMTEKVGLGTPPRPITVDLALCPAHLGQARAESGNR